MSELFLIGTNNFKIETPLEEEAHVEIKGSRYTDKEDLSYSVLRFVVSCSLDTMTARIFRYIAHITPVQHRM